jgi:hypothetical protein
MNCGAFFRRPTRAIRWDVLLAVCFGAALLAILADASGHTH